METTAHFENIPQEIARRLTAATQKIVVAVAWFTDRDLFDVLCRQAGRGLRVRLAVLGDRINDRAAESCLFPAPATRSGT